MKKVYVFDIMEIIDDPNEIINYVPGQRLRNATYEDRIAEFEEDEWEDAVDDLEHQKTAYYWNDETMELEINERGAALCECDEDGCVCFIEKVQMSEIGDDELELAQEHMRGVQ